MHRLVMFQAIGDYSPLHPEIQIKIVWCRLIFAHADEIRYDRNRGLIMG